MNSSSFSVVRLARATTLAAVIFVSASIAAAQDPGQKKAHSVAEKTSEAFQKLKPLQDAQNWNGMLAVLEGVQYVPGSYDEAVVLDMKAKIYGMTNQLSKALEPWERVVQLSDQHGYFDQKQVIEIVFYLAQLYGQEGATTKDPVKQEQAFSKALMYFKRYLENTPRPTPESLMTYASVLYYKAIGDSDNIDQGLLQQARGIIERGLSSSITPKDGFYQLLMAIQQQTGDLEGSADILELLLKRTPDKKDFWQALMATYLQLSEQTKKNPTLSREYLIRAIVTYERAQALGFLETPKDNMNLVSLYLMANQFTKGTELLYSGMKSGKIESEPNNWRLLGRYYLEANLNTRAIAVLEEAAALFPKNGEIEVQLAQIHLQMENTRKALEHAKKAIAKGNFESTKPYNVHYMIAYTAYDLGELDESAKAIEVAEKLPEAKDDNQLPKLKGVVLEALNEREAAKEAKEGKQGAAKKTASAR